jgi:hypothetical protein
MTRSSALLVAWALTCAAACASPPADQRVVYGAPARDVFPAVGDVLGSHCGSLDCHGHPARNMRIYAYNGLRLADVSGAGITTDAEYAASYESVISIDPEALAAVLDEGGARPERWIVVSKGRGSEHHKGNVAMVPGEDADRCVTSWLEGALDQEACVAAAEILPPGTE